MKQEKIKPYQILLRYYEKQKLDDLIAYYEKEVPTRFTRADIIRIALNELHKNIFRKRGRK